MKLLFIRLEKGAHKPTVIIIMITLIHSSGMAWHDNDK